jgi:hypothetical protein
MSRRESAAEEDGIEVTQCPDPIDRLVGVAGMVDRMDARAEGPSSSTAAATRAPTSPTTIPS